MTLEDRLGTVSVWVSALQRWKVAQDHAGQLWLLHDCQSDTRPGTVAGHIVLAPGGTTLADLLGKTISHRCQPRPPVTPQLVDNGGAL